MEDVSVTSKGQIVIPARIRRKYGIQPGTRLSLIEREGEIAFKPQTLDLIRKACGLFKSKTSATKELLRERARDRRREDAKLARFGNKRS